MIFYSKTMNDVKSMLKEYFHIKDSELENIPLGMRMNLFDTENRKIMTVEVNKCADGTFCTEVY